MGDESDHRKTELASDFTVADYEKARHVKDRRAIAEAIRRRFTERYIRPLTVDPHRKHGFAMMAIACLMIEALESFRQGWETSDGQSKAAFCFFFDATESFAMFRGRGQSFYTHVRCGILHQAETTGGWKIERKGPLLSADGTINATRFIETLEHVLDGFCDELIGAPWDSPEWKKVCKKMNAICKNCLAQPLN